MGSPMAANLLKAGRKVVAFDVNEAAVGALVDRGAARAESPAAVAAAAGTVVTMLPSNPHVLAVYLGERGLLAGAAPGALLVDCSTCEPSVSKEVAAAAAEKGLTYMDAPVSGGTPGAEAATLTFMVGGPEEQFREAELLLSHMGRKVVHCGGVGMGQAAKLCNNLVLGISMAAVCEGHALADRLGLDQKKLADILNTSSGRCWSSDTYNPCPGVMEGVPSSRGYTGGFACDLMIKETSASPTPPLCRCSPGWGCRWQEPGLAAVLPHELPRRGAEDFSGLYEFIAESHKASGSGK
ncbi:unnamed protein product [Prorocentrum cordatum]|uniref:3-hydroxyisobutyrate dehydrogenase n=2 Tax=Prorocentrum cordatum TaxID=2364126 RepID=A0ABN9U478_9DINO|nr:unnamed protein product [Polarella glacialis]